MKQWITNINCLYRLNQSFSWCFIKVLPTKNPKRFHMLSFNEHVVKASWECLFHAHVDGPELSLEVWHLLQWTHDTPNEKAILTFIIIHTPLVFPLMRGASRLVSNTLILRKPIGGGIHTLFIVLKRRGQESISRDEEWLWFEQVILDEE